MGYTSVLRYDMLCEPDRIRKEIVGMQPPPPKRAKITDIEKDDYSLGVSLTHSFTSNQIKQHLYSLNGSNVNSVGENTCQLCAKDGLMFAAPPINCACCGARIKTGSICYRTVDESGARYSFCSLCFNKSRGGHVSIRELSFPKEGLIRGNNVGESEEAWVQCDRCQRWQHQICALYNSKHDVEGTMAYICPICRLTELDQAVKNVSVTPILGARDLPRTMLSDHIEQRLLTSLAQERKLRAGLLGKVPEEVPGAEDLVVRTVLAVDKRVKVKQQFLDILLSENYPSEIPYKSKVILLFQKLEGAEVCLFAMYVQEFGSECGEPNQRSVYISYIDSVKYFTPDIKTVTGQALRTFVYHEILIGYLDYCKQCGFNTCYIWAYPPLKGDDYILYCHPETQRTPKSDKLRKWYKTMLKKALKDNVVAEYTNFYDYFFVPKKNQNSKITSARLPYFDGDYWTAAIEDMIETMAKNCTGESKKKPKKSMTKRTYKAMGHNGLSLDAATDIQVMTKLGHTILPMKDDFIVVRLQFTCMNCRGAILSGNHWSCNECSKFHLCDRCLEIEQSHDGFRTHSIHRGEKHTLSQITMNDLAANTKDKDVIIDNDIFENRHAFLNFCQKNNYQFDTLRRAKHSSMMILYHLHKMTVLSTGTLCSICRQDVMAGGWLCEMCSGFHVCNSCYQKEGVDCHVHELSQQLKGSDCVTKTKKVQQNRAVEVKSILDLLSHANQSMHSRNCQDSYCNFPHCMDIENHKEMLVARSELQRRAAITGQLQ